MVLVGKMFNFYSHKKEELFHYLPCSIIKLLITWLKESLLLQAEKQALFIISDLTFFFKIQKEYLHNYCH